ncbi:hypothetical protein V4B17_01075 [Bartonella sp. B23]
MNEIISEDNLTMGGLEKERVGRVINEAGILNSFTGEMNLFAAALTNKGAEATDTGQQDTSLQKQQDATFKEGTSYILARGNLLIDVDSFENLVWWSESVKD